VYRVIAEPSGLADIARHSRYPSEHAHTAGYADRWLGGVETALLELGDFPLRFATAPENDAVEQEIRHRVVGSHRVLFTVAGAAVHVPHVRHARQELVERS
jgi:plasmid stabilization system protein ParE